MTTNRLTKAQRRALHEIGRRAQFARVRLPTGEALRKMGLVTRETLEITRRIYANKDGEHIQFVARPDRPVIWHTWDLTPAGRAALQQENNHE